MPSVSEIIRQEQARKAVEEAAREQAAKKAEAERLATERTSQQHEKDEHVRKAQHLREVTDKVLAESGVLKTVEETKRNFVDGKFRKSAFFINYTEDDAELKLIWGESFAIKVDVDGNKELCSERRLFGWLPVDYLSLDVTIGTDESLTIFSEERKSFTTIVGKTFEKQEWWTDPQKITNALAHAFSSATNKYSFGGSSTPPERVHQ